MFELGIVDSSEVSKHIDGSVLHSVVYKGSREEERKMGIDKYNQSRWYRLPINEEYKPYV